MTFPEIAAVLRPALDTYFPADMGVRVIAEPGRYFVSSAFTLAVNVVARRVVHNIVSSPSVANSYEVPNADGMMVDENVNPNAVVDDNPSYMCEYRKAEVARFHFYHKMLKDRLVH